jgi:glutamate N-acetyltransferase / amino-acid N-acetyltransferase
MSVTAPMAYRAAGVAAGLKAGGARDVALVVNDGPHDAAAGVFTRNRVKAAPVLWSQQALADRRLRAVLLNSGCANAATGPAGFADTHRSAERVANALGVGAGEVAVCSTGLIGERLTLDTLLRGIDSAAALLRGDGGLDAADAIRTTDTVPKTAAYTDPAGWTVGGMTKGAGMLAPALATMLCVLTTDAVMDAATLDATLRAATAATFERIDSDGCLSTNDTVLALANNASTVTPDLGAFSAAVHRVCADLARQLLADAEGATKQVAVEVVHAAREADALEVARSIARSALLKCALFGGDANWGRVLAAVGTTAAAFDPDAIDVEMNGVAVCRASAAEAERGSVDLSGRDVHILVDLHAGDASATIWTTDLSVEYVNENSAYST